MPKRAKGSPQGQGALKEVLHFAIIGGSSSEKEDSKETRQPYAIKTRSKSLSAESTESKTSTNKRANSYPASDNPTQHESPGSPSQIPILLPVNPKLLKRFYEALVLCDTLGRNRGEYMPGGELEHGVDRAETRLNKGRRKFLKDLAYLCDYKRGGDTVTAIMLQQIDQMTVYRFASNVAPSDEDRTWDFLNDILTSFESFGSSVGNQIENQLFTMSVEFSRKRIDDYIKTIKSSLVRLFKDLKKSGLDEDSRLLTWLKDVEAATSSREEICRFTYKTRKSESFTNLLHHMNRASELSDDFKKVRHTVGRLTHTTKAVKSIIAARHQHPKLFSNFKIARVESSRPSSPPLAERFQSKPTLESMVGRLMTESTDTPGTSHFKAALRHLDHDGKLSENLRAQCISPTWKPKVHAELLLLDFAWTKEIDFVDNDKYIGTSKPACYCCRLYIRAHPGGFVVPECHNNLWLNWRPPDIQAPGQGRLVQVRSKILNKMTEIIREKVLDQIHQQQPPRPNKPDSLTLISSLLPLSLKSSVDDKDDYLESDCESVAVNSGGLEDRSKKDFSSDETEDLSDSDGGVHLSLGILEAFSYGRASSTVTLAWS